MKRKEYYLSNILQQLEAFLHTNQNRLWIKNTAIHVYVRQITQSLSIQSSQDFTSLVIANICVTERYQGQGIFTEFMTRAHELHPFDMTYLECIRNPALLQWCIKRRWTPHNPHQRTEIDCFYLLKQSPPDERITFTAQEVSILAHKIKSILFTQNASSAEARSTDASTTLLQVLLHKLQIVELRSFEKKEVLVLQEILSHSPQAVPEISPIFY